MQRHVTAAHPAQLSSKVRAQPNSLKRPSPQELTQQQTVTNDAQSRADERRIGRWHCLWQQVRCVDPW